MKPEFHEDFDSDQTSPDAEGSYGFDFQSVFAALGDPDDDTKLNPEYAPLALALQRIFKWMVPLETLGRKHAAEYIGRRVVVLLWVTDPAYFEGNPSLTSIAKSLGITPQLLHSLSGEVSREFGITNKAQDHAWNRKQQNEQ